MMEDPGSLQGGAGGGQAGLGKRLLDQLRQTRARTLDLVKPLERDDYVVQTAFFTSPPKWHVGHTSWVYEAIMGKLDDGYRFHSDRFTEYLNSYYQQFGTPGDKGSRGAFSRPTLDEVFGYFDEITARMERFIGRLASSGSLDGDAARLITMGFHHECQHQELLVYDLQHMLADQYRPVNVDGAAAPGPAGGTPAGTPATTTTGRSVDIKGGLYMMGYGGDGYCYDVELPEHRVYLEDYGIDVFPVTNRQYMEFVSDGGYRSYRYWLADGWEKVRENGWDSPMYWERADGGWRTRDFMGIRPVNPDEPVCHVSFYEADAYCRWAGRRLPTEAEWEKAACWDEARQEKTVFPWGNQEPSADRCNLLESHRWRCADVGSLPGGASPSGCQQMVGDVWEWTSSDFVGYPGFRSGFDEYNDKWFVNQKVLRGGSFGTPAMSVRASYRNFFRPDERWMFSGFRCAGDPGDGGKNA